LSQIDKFLANLLLNVSKQRSIKQLSQPLTTKQT